MEIKETGPQGGNTGKPEQPIVPHHDQDYRQSEFDQTQADLKKMRKLKADPRQGYGFVSDDSATDQDNHKNILQKIAGSTAAQIGLVGLALTTAAGAVLAPKLINREPQKIEIPSSFNPKAITQRAGAENLAQMPWADYKENPVQKWDNETKTLTTVLSIYFRGNRIPTLQVTKTGYEVRGNSIMIIDGLEGGDQFFAPEKGKIKILKSGNFMGTYYFYPDTQLPEEQDSYVYVTPGIKPLLDPTKATADGNYLKWDVEGGQSVAELITSEKHSNFNGQVQITGIGRDINQRDFNLAVTPGSSEIKAIQVTK